uniref:Protein kinase domain-containing protein n=1 Tax=Seriola lalandi dorsalis TaxID=1841481 RepID=A0A3B4XEX9_SERLL
MDAKPIPFTAVAETADETNKKPPGINKATFPVSVCLKNQQLQIEKYDVLSGILSNYLIQRVLGRGSFGQVVQCINLDTKEIVAIKIMRKDESWAAKREVFILNRLKRLDRDKNNLIKFTEQFEHKGHDCLVFEILDISIEDLIQRMTFKPLHLSEIRVIAQQMLVALDALKSLGLVHADIKPDNIMLVDHQLQPFKVKLIDFGMAVPISKVRTGTMIQIPGYRAPEVMLGLPLNEAVDMWGLGCVLAFMYLGQDPYPLHCKLEVLRVIMQIQGHPSWMLKTECIFPCCKNQGSMTNRHIKAFLSLLKRMLHVDPEKRITPSEALGHRFITMKHLPSDANPNPYVSSSYLKIKDLSPTPLNQPEPDSHEPPGDGARPGSDGGNRRPSSPSPQQPQQPVP